MRARPVDSDPSLEALRHRDECRLDRPLELRTAEGLHDVLSDTELAKFFARRIDAHAEDRHLPVPVSQLQGLPQARARCRFQEHEVRGLILGQLPLADRSMTEPQDENLEQRAGSRIGIRDQDGRHEEELRPPPVERRMALV